MGKIATKLNGILNWSDKGKQCLLFPPCSLVTDIEATLYSPTGSCDQAHCTTLCSNSEDVTHFRPGGGVTTVQLCAPLELSGSPVLRLCVTVLSQSPWEGKQVASRLFLSKKLCKRNLKKHMKKVHRGMISINWCLRNMKNIFVGQMFELAIGKLYMARTVLANLMFYATHLVDEKHKQYWGADTRKFEAALCFL